MPFDTITLGPTNCYLLRGEDGQAVLVDAGTPRFDRVFTRALYKLGVAPDRVKLVVITHGHWDHVGCAQSIRDLTGAKIAMHSAETDRLELGRQVMPGGITRWGRVLSKLLDPLMPLVPPTTAAVDVVVDDDGMSLEDYGIAGRVMHTPGHSPGSLSILLDSGEAFVGDLAMNGPPLRLGPGLPIFAEEPERLHDSWQAVLDCGVRQIYPAHGKPFAADVMRDAITS